MNSLDEKCYSNHLFFRFEEEIGMPYIPPEMDHRNANNPQYVIRTNTFNQAQQNLMQGSEPTMFVPNQVLNRPQTGTCWFLSQ